MTIRIAMWSGPRNISTAMMRSWENRLDCSVVDEPFYAFYLNQTQSPHPLFEQVVSSQSTHYTEVTNQLCHQPVATPLQFQKHMTHHMLDGLDMNWTKFIRHFFLIRDPGEIVNSYTNSRGECKVTDIGIIRQAQLYDEISQITGQTIPVIDANDVLENPEAMLTKLCDALDIEFSQSMLCWPKGQRESDGVWAKHWYQSVQDSTGFATVAKKKFTLNQQQLAVVNQVTPYYQHLKDRAICG